MKQLLFSLTKKDFDVEYLRSSKSGGQRRDKVSTAVRITHRASGAVGQSQDQRSREQNRKTAFRRLVATPKFKAWIRIQTGLAAQNIDNLDKKLDRMIENETKIEYRVKGKWVVQ